jgi:predicted aminopeptidase
MARGFASLFTALALSGCATLGYYGQAIGGHLEIVNRSRPIADLLDDPATSPALKQHLAATLAAREFASRELALPDNGSYRRYSDLGRPYAVWNVFAAPALSLEPKEWCFLVVGCVAYRGHFAREQALAAAAELRAQGYDVYVGGVTAYSTLGWFDDPLLNTMLARGDTEAAALVFHELAHQRLYARGDTAFNESFAVTVELEGVRRWLAARGDSGEYRRYFERRHRRDQLIALVLAHRARLEQLYASAASDAEKLADKERILGELRQGYSTLKASWGGDTSFADRTEARGAGQGCPGCNFDAWIAQDLNNAKLASVGLYHRYVPAFQRLLAAHGGDLTAFYAAAEALAQRSKDERVALLAAEAGAP